MRFKRMICLFPLAVLFALAPLMGQPQSAPQGSQQPPTGGPARQNRRSGRPEREPCWKKVGIPESVVEQRKSIHESTRAKLEAVCTDSSLSDQQKREQVRDVEKSAHEQMEALLTSQQREQLKDCQRKHEHGMGQHHQGEHMPGGGHSGHANPCDEILRSGRRK